MLYCRRPHKCNKTAINIGVNFVIKVGDWWRALSASLQRGHGGGAPSGVQGRAPGQGPRCSKIADFEPVLARRASAVTPSKKSSINTSRKSTTRFPMSLRWSPYVAPKPPRGLKMQNGRFPYKISLRLKKICYKVSLCENCQRQSCKAFIGLANRAKIIVGGDRFYLKFWIKLTALERNCRFFYLFSLDVAAQR